MEIISPQRQSFGDFVVDFRAEKEGATSGRIKDSGGQLSVDGKLNLSKNGQFKITLSIKIDYGDPASGFSSVDEYNLWLASTSQTNFFLHWDTGTQAGTGDNHQLYIDLPVLQRVSSPGPDISRDTEMSKTLQYEGDFDAATTEYLLGIMLKNTAPTI